MQPLKVGYDGKNFDIVQLQENGDSSSALILPGSPASRLASSPPPSFESTESNEVILRRINSPFQFDFTASVKPISLGKLHNQADFSTKIPADCSRVLDMPVKFPGSEYRIPGRFAHLGEAFSRVFAVEAAVNPRLDEYYCYLTIDQGWVGAGETQRNAGCHVDGFQGSRVWPKVLSEHSYLVSDCVPTVFYDQAFDVSGLDPRIDNFFDHFERQADETRAFSLAPYQLVLFDCYCVHRSVQAEKRQFRTFVRLSYSPRIFDRLGNTHNPLFEYSWEMVPRDFQSQLRERKDAPKHNGCTQLDLSSNNLLALPSFLAACGSLRDLNLNNNRLGLDPAGLEFSHAAPWSHLATLRLHGNFLTALSPAIGRLTYLRTLHLNNNLLSELPSELAQLTNLRELSLARNCFLEVPSVILELESLEVLGLGRNRLQSLPEGLLKMRLIKLWVNDNSISELPAHLKVSLRGHKTLKEFSFQGNPISSSLHSLSKL